MTPATRHWERAEAGEDGTILLDGRDLRLPEGGVLRVRPAALAHAVAAEWNAAGGGARGGSYGLAELTLTRLAATETVQVAADRAGAIATLLRAADTDMLCYRAETPVALVRRQDATWQPHLDWIERDCGAAFRVTAGVMPAGQPDAVAAGLRPLLERLDAGEVAALLAMVPALGSLVLGLAFLARRVGPDEAAATATLEAAWEAELWGEPEASDAARDRLARDLGAVRRFLDLRAT